MPALIAVRSGSGMLWMIHSRMRKIDRAKNSRPDRNTAPRPTCHV